jgi:hypothetical protein
VVDVPEDGATFRVMANYFQGVEEAFPMASIYCQGHLVATLGRAPDLVNGFTIGFGDGFSSMWRIADITTHVDTAGNTTCDVVPLHPPGKADGYDVRVGDVTY